jgi:glycosyltransferase involved in cell wall biosynthesis
MDAAMTGTDQREAAPATPPGEGVREFRVLFVCHSAAIGGSELYLEQMARRMAREAVVRVVCRTDPVMDRWADRLTEAGATLIRLDLRRLADLRRLRQEIGWATVVHLTLANRAGAYQVLVVLASRFGRKPLVCTHQLARETESLPLGVIGRRFRALALRSVYGSASRHIAVSAEGRGLLAARAGLDPARTVQIGNGVDLERFVPATGEERQSVRHRLLGECGAAADVVCCTVARLSAQKGLDVLVRAAAILEQRHGRRAARFVIVGDGELRAALERQIADLGVGDSVLLIGGRPPDEIPAWLAAADVFVLPSHYEGLSLAVMEAMASRLPVVITQVSGSAELVPTADDGRIVPAGDADALASAIDELVADPGLRERLGRNAYVRAQRFSWDECFARTSALLHEVAIEV